jgi:hypothetical protein
MKIDREEQEDRFNFLSVSYKEHLVENEMYNLDRFIRVAKDQKERRVDGYEPCRICKTIAIKIGLPV